MGQKRAQALRISPGDEELALQFDQGRVGGAGGGQVLLNARILPAVIKIGQAPLGQFGPPFGAVSCAASLATVLVLVLEVVVVEANHCPVLLQADHRRPWSTKQRISGRHGHLSNEAARELLASVASPRWRRVYLTHLSRDCKSRAAVEAALAGLRPALACEFAIVGAGEGTPFYELS